MELLTLEAAMNENVKLDEIKTTYHSHTLRKAFMDKYTPAQQIKCTPAIVQVVTAKLPPGICHRTTPSHLADDQYNIPGRIDILLGADLAWPRWSWGLAKTINSVRKLKETLTEVCRLVSMAHGGSSLALHRLFSQIYQCIYIQSSWIYLAAQIFGLQISYALCTATQISIGGQLNRTLAWSNQNYRQIERSKCNFLRMLSSSIPNQPANLVYQLTVQTG